ncbi:conserved hypothetical protein [Culex quinquefasciatus]|uniref:CUB domain-containing protein n=1 Tax=Culex quinquefasciatus TaxID=7176 RepID=B0W5L3_CULQU|nr:conserved hypothetical protein [Culex quinquefasciatus]|eukprot:XP_001843997.1 conserved hypothetical protein [Culex quinquefasciatus]
MKSFIFLSVLLTFTQKSFCSILTDTISNETMTSSDRQGRQFPFYSLGRIKNVPCIGTNGLAGTCQIKGECATFGGYASGTCSALTRQAVCCVYSGTCGGTSNTNANVTYFQNSGYPSPYNGGGTCSFTVVPQDSSICQLRIDFTAFTLSQPDTNGNCIVDNMQVTGGGTRFPTMCGDNNGQHIYIPFSGTSPITVSISTTAAMSFPRVWNLQLSQISCTSAYQAPAGCLQYFTGTTGDVYSFNYGVAANPAMNAMGLPGTRQLALSNYGICIQNAATYCSITYSLPATEPYAFTLTSDVTTIAPAMLGTAAVGAQGTACTTDFLVIPNPVGIAADRFCGAGLGATTSNTLPFVLYYVTDAIEMGDVANRGFHLQYVQNSCPIPSGK